MPRPAACAFLSCKTVADFALIGIRKALSSPRDLRNRIPSASSLPSFSIPLENLNPPAVAKGRSLPVATIFWSIWKPVCVMRGQR